MARQNLEMSLRSQGKMICKGSAAPCVTLSEAKGLNRCLGRFASSERRLVNSYSDFYALVCNFDSLSLLFDISPRVQNGNGALWKILTWLALF
jgi:hypothetical protein